MELKELLNNPGTAAFSRIKYLRRFGYDDQIEEFINGLFLAAVSGKHQGEWDALVEFIEQWEEVAIGLQFRSMRMPETGDTPWATLRKPLHRSTIALVTTGGLFLDGQKPFDEEGDPTYREIRSDASPNSFRIWHPGYDIGPATKDINCIFPLDHFKELEAEGLVGGLAETSYSFMGLIPKPERLIAETAPEAAGRLKDAGVDAVVLAST